MYVVYFPVLQICACTEYFATGESKYGGCAKPKTDAGEVGYPCAVAQARTAADASADALGSPLILTKMSQQVFNVTWLPPRDPNAVVLKYDVEIK